MQPEAPEQPRKNTTVLARMQGYIEVARSAAEQVLTQAESDASQIRSNARELGVAEGRAQASLDFLSLANFRDQELIRLKDEVLKLALTLAKEVVATELETSQATLSSRFHRILAESRIQEAITLTVHPQHESTFQQSLTRGDYAAYPGISIKLCLDPLLAPHCLRIHSQGFVLEADPTQHLALLAGVIAEKLVLSSTAFGTASGSASETLAEA